MNVFDLQSDEKFESFYTGRYTSTRNRHSKDAEER